MADAVGATQQDRRRSTARRLRRMVSEVSAQYYFYIRIFNKTVTRNTIDSFLKNPLLEIIILNFLSSSNIIFTYEKPST
jgi:hypothetical protein